MDVEYIPISVLIRSQKTSATLLLSFIPPWTVPQLLNPRYPTRQRCASCKIVSMVSLVINLTSPTTGGIPQQLPLPQESHGEGRDYQHHREARYRNVPLVVPRRVHLLPDDEREPSLQHVGHLVHGRNHNRALLIVVAADFMSPPITVSAIQAGC